MALALFDLDNTLLGGDSDHAWGQFLVDQGIVDARRYQDANDLFYAQYQQGGLDIHAYLRFALEPLTRFTQAELAALHRRFMAEVIAPLRLPKADALLDRHRARDDRLLIITATNSFVTRPIAHWLGVPELLATEPELRDGRYTGAYSGTPCFREGKVVRLEEWLAQTGESLAGSYFYSDSHNDLALLERVDYPVAVNPDPQLEATAQARGWPLLDLRD